jgi:hypothetical protein
MWRIGVGVGAYGFTEGTVELDVKGGYDWVLKVRYDAETQRPSVTEATAKVRPDGPPLSARAMQAASFGTVCRLAVEAVMFASPRGTGSDIVTRDLLQLEPPAWAVSQLLGHNKGGRKKETRGELVARAASAAKSAPKGKQTQWVMSRCEVGKSMAKKLVGEAKEAGLLER